MKTRILSNIRDSNTVHASAEDAAHDADEQARIYVEKEYERREAWREGERLRDLIEEKRKEVSELFEARRIHGRCRDIKGHIADITAHLADIRAFERELTALCDRHELSY